MNKQKGFTLIEMLVVIAIVGILSAVVLTSLGPARQRARDTRIISSLNQIRTLAEALYDGDFDAVTQTQAQIAPLVTDITNNGGTGFAIQLDPTTASQRYRAEAALNDGTIYCVDSSGYAGTKGSSPPNGRCTGTTSTQ